MENPVLTSAVGKLVHNAAGAGLSLEDMIELLSVGLTVDTLLWLISWHQAGTPSPAAPSSMRWLM
jgi:hypothetical protein